MSYDYAQLPASLATHEAIAETLSRNEDAEGLQALGLWVRVLMTACTDDQPKSVAALALIGNVRRSTAERIAHLAVDTGLARRDGDRYQFLHVEEAFLGVKARRAKEADRKRTERAEAKKTNDSATESPMSAGQNRTSRGQDRTSAHVLRMSGHRIEENRIEENRTEEEDCSLRSQSRAVRPEPHDDGLPSPKGKSGAERRAIAKRVFAFWQAELGHPKAILTPDRLAKIEARLRELEPAYAKSGDEADEPEKVLRTAIAGLSSSAFHRGENAEGKRYDGIKVVFRDAEQVDKFYNLGVAELERREKLASRREPKPTMPIAGPEPALESIENKETTGRSFEQLNRFYEALNGTNDGSVKKLEEYLLRYPDDEQAIMHLALKRGTP